MALRGDDTGFQKPISVDRTRNEYAIDLVKQIADMNRGQYLEELIDAAPTEFCVGVAGYPEKHFEAPNITWDVLNLKRKVDAGADYITSQMFFDNAPFLDFVERCRDVGITVPIVPGLKILTRKRQLQTLPARFHLQIPEALAAECEAAKNDSEVAEIGIRWALKQCEGLMEAGFSNLHFYIIQTPQHVREVVGALRKMA
jgi:methylenetetrahydrofolate reductase (NADPH)